MRAAGRPGWSAWENEVGASWVLDEYAADLQIRVFIRRCKSWSTPTIKTPCRTSTSRPRNVLPSTHVAQGSATSFSQPSQPELGIHSPRPAVTEVDRLQGVATHQLVSSPSSLLLRCRRMTRVPLWGGWLAARPCQGVVFDVEIRNLVSC